MTARRCSPPCALCGPTPHYWYERQREMRDRAIQGEAAAWVLLQVLASLVERPAQPAERRAA